MAESFDALIERYDRLTHKLNGVPPTFPMTVKERRWYIQQIAVNGQILHEPLTFMGIPVVLAESDAPFTCF